MKIINKLGLPQPIVDAIRDDDYDSGSADITVTSLIAPIQQTLLRQKYKDELEMDVADNIYALLGKGVHYILEKSNDGSAVEERFMIEVDGVKFSGQVDRISPEGILSDWKVMSVWEYIYGLNPEKIQQLNCYAYLAKDSCEINALEIVGIFRDWQLSKAKTDSKYPSHQVHRFPIPMWSRQEQESFIKSKIELFKRAWEGEDFPCTSEERWQKEEKWAVMKEKRKSAVKLYTDMNEAYRHVSEYGDPKLYVEHRPGESTRCESYCVVKDVCPQYLSMKGEYNA